MSTPVADAKWRTTPTGRDKLNAAGTVTEREVHCFDGNLDVFTGTFYAAELDTEFDISLNGVGGSVSGSVGGGAIRLVQDLGEVSTLQIKADTGAGDWTDVEIRVNGVTACDGQTVPNDGNYHSFALNDALAANSKIEVFSLSSSSDHVYVKLV